MTGVRVLHVTESMAAGTHSLLVRLTARQVEAGAAVSVSYLGRPESPSSETLRAQFHDAVTLTRLDSRQGGVARIVAIHRAVRAALLSGRYDVVHLHSSFAGFAGRLAAVTARSRTAVLHSPHGLSILRLNTSVLMRAMTQLVELALARVGTLVLISESEMRTARRALRPRRAALLRNGVDVSQHRGRLADQTSHPPVVAMIGRVTYQKAPWRFAHVASALTEHARFVWIGDGEPEDRRRWLGDAPVEVTGWLSTEEVHAMLPGVSVLVFATLWEGMPMSVMEAQACGIPAVVSAVVGNQDVVDHGVTGYVVGTEAELIACTRELVTDPALRARMSRAAVRWAESELSDERLGRESLAIYRDAMDARARP